MIKKAGALIFSSRGMLIVRPRSKPFFINPGGKYKEDESPIECLTRELDEELKVKLASCNPYRTYEIGKAAHSNYPLSLELYLVEIDGEIAPSSEIEEVAWMDQTAYHQNTFNVAPSFHQFVPDLIQDGYL